MSNTNDEYIKRMNVCMSRDVTQFTVSRGISQGNKRDGVIYKYFETLLRE